MEQFAVVEQWHGAVIRVVTGTREQCIAFAMQVAVQNLDRPSRAQLEKESFLAGDPQVNDYAVFIVPCLAL